MEKIKLKGFSAAKYDKSKKKTVVCSIIWSSISTGSDDNSCMSVCYECVLVRLLMRILPAKCMNAVKNIFMSPWQGNLLFLHTVFACMKVCMFVLSPFVLMWFSGNYILNLSTATATVIALRNAALTQHLDGDDEGTIMNNNNLQISSDMHTTCGFKLACWPAALNMRPNARFCNKLLNNVDNIC